MQTLMLAPQWGIVSEGEGSDRGSAAEGAEGEVVNSLLGGGGIVGVLNVQRALKLHHGPFLACATAAASHGDLHFFFSLASKPNPKFATQGSSCCTCCRKFHGLRKGFLQRRRRASFAIEAVTQHPHSIYGFVLHQNVATHFHVTHELAFIPSNLKNVKTF